MSASPAEIPRSDGAMSPSQLFVINLCASTSPMALAQPNVPALKRYTFFVSRQRDDGRDRFRLHMGYFASQEEAEQLLEAVRDVYPAAWTGPAPAGGAQRRNRTATKAEAVKPVAEPAAIVPVSAVAVAPSPPPPPAAPEVAIQPLPDMLDKMSNVREVLAELDDSTAPRLETQKETAQPPLGESEVLRVLEASAKSAAATGEFLTQPQAEVRLLTLEDTQSLAAIQNDVDNDAPPCFAVQLVWSVSPIDVARLPHLAIFDAYTLYNVEGNRDGRKWYGVRLGFFSDSTAAVQVANYVRSDYRAVAVVPVAVKERDGAGGDAAPKSKPKAATPHADGSKPAARVPVAHPIVQPGTGADNTAGFQLLEDDRPAPLKRDFDDKPAAKAGITVPVAKPVVSSATKAAPKPAGKVAAKSAGKPTGKRVVVRKRTPPRPGAPNPLESTLEILGASTLTLDNTRAVIDDHVVRKPLDRKSGGRFAKLLGRLSGS